MENIKEIKKETDDKIMVNDTSLFKIPNKIETVKSRFLKRSKLELFFIFLFGFSVFCLFLFIFIFTMYGTNLPDYNKLAEYKPPVTSRFYAGDGSLLTEYATEQRIFVPFKDIPPNLINAFIAAEDKRFWNHHGIDIMGIIRATIINTTNKVLGSGHMIGASTITQQVAKNFFLSSEQSFSRKIKEIILSLKMERAFSKRHILTLYFNQIFLGFRSYGVASAALNYFNKSLRELTLAESAFLAALPKAPNNYNPLTNKERATDRRNWVLKRMFQDGYITHAEFEGAKREEIILSESFVQKNQRYSLYFSEEIRKYLSDIYGEEQLYRGGLNIHTTLNHEYQKIATNSLRKALINFDKRQGWRGAEKNVNIDDPKWLEDSKIVNQLKNTDKQLWQILLNKTELYSGAEDNGWKKAIVLNVNNDLAEIGLSNGEIGVINLKSSSWKNFIVSKVVEDSEDKTKNKTISQTLKINYMTDMLHKGDIVFVKKTYDENFYSLEQVPLINGAVVIMNPHTGQVYAMVGGFSYTRSKFNRVTQAYRQPGSTIKPFVYLTALEKGYTPSSLILDAPVVMQKSDGSLWRPENYDNTFAGEMTLRRALEQSKNNPTVRIANDVGVRSFLRTAQIFGLYKNVSEPNLSMALGSQDLTLLELTSAFAKIINGGRDISPVLVDRVANRNGNFIYRSDSRKCENCNTTWQDDLIPPEIEDDKKLLVNPVSLYQLVSILQGVVERGSGWKARIDGKTICGKTGTSNDQHSVWFVGGTPDLVAGVFLGYDTPRSLGDYSSGGSLAAPVFKDFMTDILKDKKNTVFRQPNGVILINVNRETGKPANENDPNYLTILEAFKQGTTPSVATNSNNIKETNNDSFNSETEELNGIY